MEFYIADRLGMTVTRMRAEMSQAEYVHWSIYHQRRAQKKQHEQQKQRGKELAQKGAQKRGR